MIEDTLVSILLLLFFSLIGGVGTLMAPEIFDQGEFCGLCDKAMWQQG